MAGIGLVLFYVAGILLPVILAVVLGTSAESFIESLALHLALMGFVLLGFQFVLAARVKWMERPFGLDIVIRFHQHMAVLAGLLLLAHPLLLAAGDHGWTLIVGLDVAWPIWLGRAALLLLILSIFVSKFQSSLGLSFESWRLGHDLISPTILTAAFLHSWVVGDDLEHPALRALWIAIFATAVLLLLYHRVIRPRRLARKAYRVTSVHPEAEDVWTLSFQPPEGEQIPPYHPGQFHFVTLIRGRGFPAEEHHWTISSSPTQKGQLSSTIKALGDFTATVGKTRIGDRAAVHGAFGRFSHTLHPEERDLVFLAGGIGITPLMSIIRYLRDTEDARTVLLIYGNVTEDSIVFRDELAGIEAGDHPRLRVVHVLSDPSPAWRGETGFLTREKIEHYCESAGSGGCVAEQSFYVCGPPPMLRTVIQALKEMGVKDRRIRQEIFSLLD